MTIFKTRAKLEAALDQLREQAVELARAGADLAAAERFESHLHAENRELKDELRRCREALADRKPLSDDAGNLLRQALLLAQDEEPTVGGAIPADGFAARLNEIFGDGYTPPDVGVLPFPVLPEVTVGD